MRLATLLTLALVVLSPPLVGQSIHPGGPADGGVRATCDLPASLHMRNTGGSDGLGLCVPTSCEVGASRWQSSPLDGFQAWCRQRPGGSYPDKLEQSIVQFCREKGRPIPKFVQHTGGDEAILDLAMKTGRMVGITYAGQDDFYRNETIAHMVDLAHFDQSRAAIIDSNRPGVWVWMSRKELLDRWRGVDANGRSLMVRDGLRSMPVGGGWAVVFLDPPPPPYAVRPADSAATVAVDQVLYGQCPGGVCPTSPPADGNEYLWWNGQWARVVKPAPAPEAKKAEAKADPQPEAKPEEAKNNFGVDTSKLSPGKWFHNGHETTRELALAAVAGDALADDSERWFLVCVGTPADQAKFAAAAKALDPATADKLHVKAYGPADWQVSQFGLPAGVSVRRPAKGRVGEEVGRLAGEISADTLKRFVGDAISPPKPMPPPAPDQPQPTPAPEPAPTPTPPGVPTWLLALGALAALMLFWRKKP